jgi:hypothetical protein
MQEISLSQQMIDMDAQSMSRQFAIHTGAQPPERVSEVLLDTKMRDATDNREVF